jgi:hypothetical protein
MKKNKVQNKRRILYVGQAYYNAWYLSRELRKLGWNADVLNYDNNEKNQMYYHGEDIRLNYRNGIDRLENIRFYFNSLTMYDIFYFSNAHCLYFIHDFDVTVRKNKGLRQAFITKTAKLILGGLLKWNPDRIRRFIFFIGVKNVARIMKRIKKYLPERWDVKILKKCGKKIVYSNNGCHDGGATSSFRAWGPEPVCDICKWHKVPSVCSDERNLAWGKLRNSLADYQVTIGSNRKDNNDSPMVHEVPDYVNELPVISATPETVYHVLKDLVKNPAKREEIGRKSREFAVKWHSAKNVAKRFDRIYSELLVQTIDNEIPKGKFEVYRNVSIYKSAGHFNQAEKWFKWLVENSNDSQMVAGAYFHLGEMAFLNEQGKRSGIYFLKCLQLNPGHRKAMEYKEKMELG